MNWLERAGREIPKNANRPTAKTDDRTLTAVTAVPHLGKSGNFEPSLSDELERLIAIAAEHYNCPPDEVALMRQTAMDHQQDALENFRAMVKRWETPAWRHN